MDAVLIEDGSQVGLRHVIGEGAVAEHASGVAAGGELLVPVGDTQGQRFGVSGGDDVSRQAISTPPPMAWTRLPAI